MGLLPSPNWCANTSGCMAAHRTHDAARLRRCECAQLWLDTRRTLAARYGSQLADWASEGAGGEALCAFAARNSVLLLRPLSQRVAGSLTGHTNRVTVRARGRSASASRAPRAEPSAPCAQALAFLRAPGVEHMLLTGTAQLQSCVVSHAAHAS